VFGAGGVTRQTSNPQGLTTLTEGHHYTRITAVASEDGTVVFTWRNGFGISDADADAGVAILNGLQLVENASAVLQPLYLFASGGVSAVDLSWVALDEATSYKVYRSTSRASGYSLLGSVLDNSYMDTSATPGVTYYYVVTALNGSDESFFSGEASGMRDLLIADADLDGLSDADEALIGTNPNDSSDFFVAKTSSVTRNGANYDISFVINGAQGSYVIERSSTLQAGSWSEVGTPVTWTWTDGVQDNLNLSASGVIPTPGGKEFFRAKGLVPSALD
jgi:hypothetical protein